MNFAYLSVLSYRMAHKDPTAIFYTTFLKELRKKENCLEDLIKIIMIREDIKRGIILRVATQKSPFLIKLVWSLS